MERVWPEVQDIGALRERARALGVEGAEGMSEEQLKEAVARAQQEAEKLTGG